VRKAIADVRAFMEAGGQKIRDLPEIPADESAPVGERLSDTARVLHTTAAWLAEVSKTSERAFRAWLIVSEVAELVDALAREDVIDVADALADIDYVTIGTAIQFGIPHEKVWNTVQDSNMAKFPGGVAIRDVNGKIQKPPGWKPPDIAGVLGV
jgi:predicted HAD superfamily Cof-like phosphohydrolase